MEFVPSVQNITKVLNRGPSMDRRVLSPANTVGLPPWGQESERVNIAFTSKQRGGWSALRETWLFGWSISSAELYAAQGLVLVCHYNTKVIPPYYGFSWRFAYAALNSRSNDRFRGVFLFIVGPLCSGSLITTAAASGALLWATLKSTDPALKYIHCVVNLMGSLSVYTYTLHTCVTFMESCIL